MYIHGRLLCNRSVVRFVCFVVCNEFKWRVSERGYAYGNENCGKTIDIQSISPTVAACVCVCMCMYVCILGSTVPALRKLRRP